MKIKKIIILLLIPFIFVSCIFERKKYSVLVVVFYPTQTDTINIIGLDIEYPRVYSIKGSNYIGNLYATTAPIKILSVKEVK